MPMFQKVKTVEAHQFTGGIQNGSDLAFWVNSNKARAEWQEAKHIQPEMIILYYVEYHWHCVYVGDWIVLHADGSFTMERPQTFEAEYVNA